MELSKIKSEFVTSNNLIMISPSQNVIKFTDKKNFSIRNIKSSIKLETQQDILKYNVKS